MPHTKSPSEASGSVSTPSKNPAENPGKGKKLLDQVRQNLRIKHYSYRTEEMGRPEIEAFLTHLAVKQLQHPHRPEILGHKDIKTTMNYTRLLQHGDYPVRSPLDEPSS